MKNLKYVLLLCMLSVGGLRAKTENYMSSFAIKNIMLNPARVQIIYIEHANASERVYLFDQMQFRTAGYDLGIIQPSGLHQPGNLYENTVQFGRWAGEGPRPQILAFIVNPIVNGVQGSAIFTPRNVFQTATNLTEEQKDAHYRKLLMSTFLNQYKDNQPTGFIPGSAGAHNWLHYLITSSGSVIQVAQLYYDGSIRLSDGTMVNSELRNKLLPEYPSINADGTLSRKFYDIWGGK